MWAHLGVLLCICVYIKVSICARVFVCVDVLVRDQASVCALVYVFLLCFIEF